jgi:hypothetical protein
LGEAMAQMGMLRINKSISVARNIFLYIVTKPPMIGAALIHFYVLRLYLSKSFRKGQV